jgi:hypothetical protein
MGFAFVFGSSWTVALGFVFVGFTFAGDVCALLSGALAFAWPDDFCEATPLMEDAGVGCCRDDLRIDFSFPSAGLEISSSPSSSFLVTGAKAGASSSSSEEPATTFRLEARGWPMPIACFKARSLLHGCATLRWIEDAGDGGSQMWIWYCVGGA